MSIKKVPIEDLLVQGLDRELHDRVVEEACRSAFIAIDNTVNKLKAEVETIVREEVEKYTIGAVEKLYNLLQLTEDIGIKILYKGDICEDIKSYRTKLEKVVDNQ